MAVDLLTHPFGMLKLARPGAGDAGLRAWDAADEWLLAALKGEHEALPSYTPRPQAPARIAVIDDGFGTLTLGLRQAFPQEAIQPLGDAATARDALAINAHRNELEVGHWCAPGALSPDTRFDLIVLKWPKHFAYLEYLLRWANDHLTEEGQLWAGGMIKHIPERCAEACRRLLRDVQVLPAWRKSRVIVARAGAIGLADWNLMDGYPLPGGAERLEGLPNVFGREQLDKGTRLFLPHVPTAVGAASVVDLGCGNGILGIVAGLNNPQADVVFVDVSAQAVQSAERNWRRLVGERLARFEHADGLAGAAPASVDWILCNPPFHEQGVVGDHIAWRLFTQAHRALRPGGRLRIVGNRHLGYHVKLQRLFGQVRQLDADPRFVVLEAVRR